MRLRLLMTLLVMCCGWADSAPGQDALPAEEGQAILEEMLTAWKAREERFRTGRIEFETAQVYPAGALVGPEGAAISAPRRVVVKCSIVFDGRRGRYEERGDTLNLDCRALMPQTFVTTYDGRYRHRLFQRHDSAAPHPHGNVDAEGALFTSGNSRAGPVYVAFRPLTAELNGFDTSGWAPLFRRGTIDGRPVVLVRQKLSDYAFDPAREYVPVRKDMRVRPAKGLPPKLYKRREYEYRLDPEWGWLPETWTKIEMSLERDAVVNSYTGRVTATEFNGPVSDADFQIDFPPGTTVYHGGLDARVVVRENGEFRRIDDEELRAGKTVAELMQTDPPSLIASRRRLWRNVLIGLAVAGFTAGIVYWRRTS